MTHDATHSLHVTDPYPRFIRETFIAAGEPGVRVFPLDSATDSYVVVKRVVFGSGADLTLAGHVSRRDYDNLDGDLLVAGVRAEWGQYLRGVCDWAEEGCP